MRVALYSPWNNRWRKDFSEEFERLGHQAEWVEHEAQFDEANLPDLVFAMWSNEWTAHWFKRLAGKTKLVAYIRSYEMYHQKWVGHVPWDAVSAVFFCAPQVRDWCEHFWGKLLPARRHVVLNGIDPDEINLGEVKAPHKIGMVSNINGKKGFDLAVQIMAGLPSEYTLEVAGGMQDMMIAHYLDYLIQHLKLTERITFLGTIPWEKVGDFLQDKQFILSTSIKEGCPMSVIEGMAAGCTPIIHNWPGAMQVFPDERVFSTIPEAIETIIGGKPDKPLQVRDRFLRRFNANFNVPNVVSLALDAIA